MKPLYLAVIVLAFLDAVAIAQNHAADLPTDRLLSQPGPTFRIGDDELKSPVTFIVYGDMRFTDPANTEATNPRVRKWLVQKIAEEAPAAIFLNGDVPLAGDMVNDYRVYRTETEPWRTARIRVYPALETTSSTVQIRSNVSRTGGTLFLSSEIGAGIPFSLDLTYTRSIWTVMQSSRPARTNTVG